MMAAVGPSMALADLDERVAARNELMQPGGKVHTRFGVIDKLLAKSSTKFYLGDEIGLADVSVFVAACMLAGGCAHLLLFWQSTAVALLPLLAHLCYTGI